MYSGVDYLIIASMALVMYVFNFSDLSLTKTSTGHKTGIILAKAFVCFSPTSQILHWLLSHFHPAVFFVLILVLRVKAKFEVDLFSSVARNLFLLV